MHDIRAIRENPAAFDDGLRRRGISSPSSEEKVLVIADTFATRKAQISNRARAIAWNGTYSALVLRLDASWKKDTRRVEALRAEQRKLADRAGSAKKSGNSSLFEQIQIEAKANRNSVANAEKRLKKYEEARHKLLMSIPNLPLAEVPEGKDEDDNVELRRWGTPRAFDFKPLEHFDIPGVKPGMDFETAAKLSGARFVVLRGAVIRVHRALAQMMLDTHITDHGLTETWTPVLVKEEAMYGTNQLPKFAEDSYQTTNGWWLVPTSEVTLTNTVAGDVLDEAHLPIRMTAHTQCFRSEAGSAGKDTTGMLRQHQFEKVEMVSITTPDTSLAEHDRMTRCAEAILEKLGLPYRTIVLCTGDMGFGAQKTHDLEVWLPGQNRYREISSVSVCGDFQARRMNARFRPAGGGKPEFVHTLNGSGLAVGRCLIAVLENGQQADGSVDLPAALHPYLGGKTRIAADGTLA